MNSACHTRIQTVLSGETPDRPAFALWHHFPEADRSPEELAAATVAFAHAWRPDLIKHTPNGMYAVEDWARLFADQPSLDVHPDVVPYALNLPID